jgi:hypothetical protein
MSEMIDRCMAHAGTATKDRKQDGLDHEKLGHAMMADAVALSFELDKEQR